MNGLKNNQPSAGSAATAGILGRLRRLISPARLINGMAPAMAGEPSGAVEIVERWRAEGIVDRLKVDIDNDTKPGPGQVAPSHAEVLLRSACDLLCSQPITLISATSLILPPESGLTTRQLADMASLMAIEYGLLADVSVVGDHVHVRLTRRIPRMPTRMRANENHIAAPISVRGPRKGRN